MADKDANREYDSTLVESLKLIIQSQLVLSDLQSNQRRLETLIAELDSTEDADGDRK